jgi:hypothetical protein
VVVSLDFSLRAVQKVKTTHGMADAVMVFVQEKCLIVRP